MDLVLYVWRQESPDKKGQMVKYNLSDVSKIAMCECPI